MTLEERLQRLEDDRTIRDLKARYLRACDLKQPETVRDCLHPEQARIAFEGFPEFSNRDDFVAVYATMGCVPEIYDMHHGGNGVIAFETADRARGQWTLDFRSINLAARTVTRLGVEYDDLYVRAGGRWWIAETASRRTSCLIESVDEAGAVRVVALGEAPTVYGEAG